MENPNSFPALKAWLLFGLSTVGMVIFSGLYFVSPKNSGNIQPSIQVVTNTVMQTVTNEVVKEVPKEVEKIINVPAAIPDAYVQVMDFFQTMTNASYVPFGQVLFKMKNVRVECFVSDAIKETIGEDEVRAKFELTLRRNNVPISPDSPNVVHLTIDAFFVDTSREAVYFSTKCYLDERQWVFRQGECHKASVTVWIKGGNYGEFGINKMHDGLLSDVENCAEMFANDFLSANPKP